MHRYRLLCWTRPVSICGCVSAGTNNIIYILYIRGQPFFGLWSFKVQLSPAPHTSSRLFLFGCDCGHKGLTGANSARWRHTLTGIRVVFLWHYGKTTIAFIVVFSPPRRKSCSKLFEVVCVANLTGCFSDEVYFNRKLQTTSLWKVFLKVFSYIDFLLKSIGTNGFCHFHPDFQMINSRGKIFHLLIDISSYEVTVWQTFGKGHCSPYFTVWEALHNLMS